MKILLESLTQNKDLIQPLALLHQQVFGHLRPDKTLVYFEERYRSRLENRDIPFTIVAKSDEGKLLGAASLVENDMTTNKQYTPWLGGVMVKEEYRKHKVGRQLVQSIENYAAKLGFENIYLFTFDREPFYKYMGYGRLKTDFYLGKEVTLMVKTIKETD